MKDVRKLTEGAILLAAFAALLLVTIYVPPRWGDSKLGIAAAVS